MKKVTILIIGVIAFFIISVIGFMITLNLSLVDAIYMTVITISTVGYESIGVMNTGAKVISIFVIFVSVGILGYVLGAIFRFLSEGNINESWRLKKMIK